ncbi:aromatic-L-amino-acid decarboxylase [Rhizomicrobium palustre]|uniref:Aromatic-L-amino-acid decarboxylase n=1 Tax=Rhizomicrobium palustre TaxID=189966 RepID=A0A846N2W6_9PROT|nr:pyridoxal-dependent decarboxylase [Rhizomicrobium palustre]NIK89859.1 aromatic-L-amino-acid decarboxylase [Rhizomicrobium palustre]
MEQREPNLDPENWDSLRREAHAMLDDMLDYIAQIRTRPVWQPIPDEKRAQFRAPLPQGPSDLRDVYQEFAQDVLPYAAGNVHPGFMGWVNGGGTAVGMLAEMLAGGINANLGGRDHMPVEVERQIVAWMREILGFPETATGLFVTGSSLANFIGILVARTAALGPSVRKQGVGGEGSKLRAYASAAAHRCIPLGMDLSGLGSDAVRPIPFDGDGRMDIPALKAAIAEDRAAGLKPFLVVGTAGTVDTGAVDDLDAIADLCAAEKLHFHIDGAFGAMAVLSPELKPLMKGLERADSIAFDFHKWAQVPYDAGFVMVRDGALHRDTFASPAAYLRTNAKGLAAGAPWFSDFGPDLSRGFRALKTWFTLKTYGLKKMGEVVAHSCALAKHLEERIRAEPKLELLTPARLNIVCFRYGSDDALNARLVIELQETGVAAPSTTTINGKLAIRCAFVNHRTRFSDVDAMVNTVLRLGVAVVAR